MGRVAVWHLARFGRHAAYAVFGFGLLAAAPAASLAAEDDPALLTAAGGIFDVGEDTDAFEARLEFRSGRRFWLFKPFAGAMATSEQSVYGYAGVLIDLYWGRRIVTTFSFAPGLYHEGDGKDLGHVVEFRSQAEIAYRFDNRSRLGLSFGHMSNAGLDERNPGQESLMVNWSMPLRNLLGD